MTPERRCKLRDEGHSFWFVKLKRMVANRLSPVGVLCVAFDIIPATTKAMRRFVFYHFLSVSNEIGDRCRHVEERAIYDDCVMGQSQTVWMQWEIFTGPRTTLSVTLVSHQAGTEVLDDSLLPP